MEQARASRDANSPSTYRDLLNSLQNHIPDEWVHPPKHTPGPTNAEILGHRPDQYRKTLHDLESKSWWFRFHARGDERNDFFAYIQNYGFLTEVRHSETFHRELPPLESAAHDVWIVCKRRNTMVEATRHWSLYTQGHLLHLAADKKKPDNGILQTGIAIERLLNLPIGKIRRFIGSGVRDSTPIWLRHEDVSNPGPRDPNKKKKKDQESTFIAYHVGRTDYDANQVYNLGEFVIDEMKQIGTYSILENNCQHFILSLMRRIVMTQRKGLAICGTKLDIAMYDKQDPDYELKPWLTTWKSRLLIIPHAKSTDRPKGLRVYRPSLSVTWPRWVQKILFDGVWLQIARQVARSSDPLGELRTQVERHVGSKRGWAVYEKTTFGLWFFASSAMVTLAAEVLTVEAAKSACAAGFAGAAAHAPPAIAALATKEALFCFALAFVTWMIVTRMFLSRGSLTIKHYNIKKQCANPQPNLRNTLTSVTSLLADPLSSRASSAISLLLGEDARPELRASASADFPADGTRPELPPRPSSSKLAFLLSDDAGPEFTTSDLEYDLEFARALYESEPSDPGYLSAEEELDDLEIILYAGDMTLEERAEQFEAWFQSQMEHRPTLPPRPSS